MRIELLRIKNSGGPTAAGSARRFNFVVESERTLIKYEFKGDASLGVATPGAAKNTSARELFIKHISSASKLPLLGKSEGSFLKTLEAGKY